MKSYAEYLNIPEKKICSYCKVVKPANAFSEDFGQKSGLRCNCKQCVNEKSVAKRQEQLKEFYSHGATDVGLCYCGKYFKSHYAGYRMVLHTQCVQCRKIK